MQKNLKKYGTVEKFTKTETLITLQLSGVWKSNSDNLKEVIRIVKDGDSGYQYVKSCQSSSGSLFLELEKKL